MWTFFTLRNRKTWKPPLLGLMPVWARVFALPDSLESTLYKSKKAFCTTAHDGQTDGFSIQRCCKTHTLRNHPRIESKNWYQIACLLICTERIYHQAIFLEHTVKSLHNFCISQRRLTNLWEHAYNMGFQ